VQVRPRQAGRNSQVRYSSNHRRTRQAVALASRTPSEVMVQAEIPENVPWGGGRRYGAEVPGKWRQQVYKIMRRQAEAEQESAGSRQRRQAYAGTQAERMAPRTATARQGAGRQQGTGGRLRRRSSASTHSSGTVQASRRQAGACNPEARYKAGGRNVRVARRECGMRRRQAVQY